MSAESPRRCRVGGPLVVPPVPPSDRSLMDTVSGFINDVTLTNAPSLDTKDIIQWARFEIDVEEARSEYEADGDVNSLFLVIGYGSGVQVWSIQGCGEAQEVLSWRQGSVRVLRLLPTPSKGDHFTTKRPLIALCDSAGTGVPFCSLTFISLTGGEQVKSIKFKNPILDVVANRRSIVVSFSERLAVFDARTLEDRVTVTTCYPAPCPLGGLTPTNPLALGDRWLAYADKRLQPTKRTNGGWEGEGVSSYTATVLHAAKSLGKGLRGLGESVLGGGRGAQTQSPSPPHSEHLQPGVVTIIDIQGPQQDENHTDDDGSGGMNGVSDSIVAHFLAHSESIIAMKFDTSGMILITADKRGHDFHVFRIHPHPSGPTLASVHHLYILHRGDTTAKVQDISISLDCRWAAISTLRGTTHIFPMSPYGGGVGVRTHVSPHVVNRMSRFHRSAGLVVEGRSSSPVGDNLSNSVWYPNPRLPPYPVASIQPPLAQLRPIPPSSTLPLPLPTHTITRTSSGRQRLSSLSEESQLPLAVCSHWSTVRPPPTGPPSWAPPRAPPTPATQSLFIMSAHGYLLHYHLHPKHISGVPKEKVCDDTNIEVEVEIKAQWNLQRPPLISHDILAPLPSNNILVRPGKHPKAVEYLDAEDRWLSQVEIMTHAGPHRRLWMGPQFVFKTYNAVSGTNLSHLDSESVEIGTGPAIARSNPVNMPGGRPIVPVLIESGSASSLEHSPRLSDAFHKHTISSYGEGDGINVVMSTSEGERGEGKLKEDLAEAMKDAEQGCEWSMEDWSRKEEVRSSHVHRIVNPLGTVTSGASSSSPSPQDKDDEYAMSNEDEALFRPVVSAPRSLHTPGPPPTRPLSSTLLLPVQRISPQDSAPLPSCPPTTLSDRVVIPAKLTLHNQTFKPTTESVKSLDFAMNPKPKVISDSKVKQVGAKDDNKEVVERGDTRGGSIGKEVKEISKKETGSTSKQGRKQKGRDKKKEDDNSGSQVNQKESKKILESLAKDITSEANVTPKVECYIEEISKAVDNIEFINNEVVTNTCTPTVGYGRSALTKAPSPCKVNTTCPSVQLCSDSMQENLDVFDDVSPSSAIPPDIKQDDHHDNVDVTTDFQTKDKAQESNIDDCDKVLGKDFKTSEDAAWELLTNIQTATKYEDIVTVEKAVDSTGDTDSKKKKKNKAAKGQQSSYKSDSRKSEGGIEIKNPDEKINGKKVDLVKDDVVFSDSFKPSWSSIASSAGKKKEVEKYIEPVEENVTLVEDDVSKVYTRNNIVLAMCDTPLNELHFVEEHHSVFTEPPPLEPLDLVLDEEKIQEMGDSLLDYSPSSPSCNISTPNLHFDVNNFVNTYAYSESIKTKETSETTDNNDDNIDLKQCKSKLLAMMDKSSDEENISPLSSQTESDDANIATSEVNVVEDDVRETTIMAPPAAEKAVKKKSKRKRR